MVLANGRCLEVKTFMDPICRNIMFEWVLSSDSKHDGDGTSDCWLKLYKMLILCLIASDVVRMTWVLKCIKDWRWV